MAPLFYEYPLGFGARLAYTVRWIGLGITAGGGIGFLLALAASLTVNEAFIDLWYEFDGDPFSRVLVPLLFVALVAGLGVFGVSDSIYNWVFARQLANASTSSPGRVPAAWQRTFVNRPNPFTGVNAALWIAFGGTLLFAVIIVAVLGETSDEELTFVTSMLIGALAIAAVCFFIALLLRRAVKRRWSALTAPAITAWSTEVVHAAMTADKERRPRRGERIDLGRAHRALSMIAGRGWNVALGATLAGAAIGFLGVAIRQPCKRCDQRSYGTFGEALIDNLAVIGAVVAALGILVFIIVGLASLGSRTIADRAIRQNVAPVTDSYLPAELLKERMTGVSTVEGMALLSSALGTVAATASLSISALAIDLPGPAGALLAAGILLLVLAATLTFAGVGGRIALRNRLRERWAPGDVPPIPSGTKKRR